VSFAVAALATWLVVSYKKNKPHAISSEQVIS